MNSLLCITVLYLKRNVPAVLCYLTVAKALLLLTLNCCFFRVLSRFEDQTDPSDSFALRWGDGSDGGGWMKESKKPEQDVYLSSTITSLDDR